MRRRWLLALPLLAGCRPAGVPDTVFYASGADLQSLNPLVTTHPLARQVQKFLFSVTLARYDSAMRVVPYLAESWTWSADRRVLDLALRSDVRWHDGTPVTAADVSFTLEAARDPVTGYPRGSDLSCLEQVTASAHALSLRFCRPQEAFPDVLTDLALLPAHRLAGVARADLRRHDWDAAPLGCGPFRLAERVPRRRWVFEANADFPAALGGPPRVGRLAVVIVDEPTTKLAALVGGELHVAGIAPMHASVVRRAPEHAVLDYPLLLTYGLAWNTSRPPFDDARLRRALTMAIDRRRLVDAYLYGFGAPADGPVPPGHPLEVAVPGIPFDRAAAATQLDALGWRPGSDGVRARGGRRLSFALLTVGSADNVLEQLVQSDLAAVGVEVTIRQLELGAFLGATQGAARDFDAAVNGVTGDLSGGWLAALFDSRRRAGPLQLAQYADPSVDAAFDRGDLSAVQRLVARDVPITFLYHARGVQGISTRLRGVRMDLRGELPDVTRWHLAPAGATGTAHAVPLVP